MIPATRGEHVHVRQRGKKKDRPLGYRIVGYEVDESGVIGDILVRGNDGKVVPLVDLETVVGRSNRRVEIVTFDWIGCCDLQDGYTHAND